MKTHQFITKNYFLIALASVLTVILLVIVIAYAQKPSSINTQTYGRNRNAMQNNDHMGNYSNNQNSGPNEYQQIEQTIAPTTTELPQQAKDAIYAALDDEYTARATYQAVLDKFGNVKPFTNIIKAEGKHIDSLVLLLNNYGLDAPANPYTNLTAKDTLSDNCSVGVQAEIANVSLYRDQLLPAVAAYPDITATFTNLMNASQQKHLPAFTRCAS